MAQEIERKFLVNQTHLGEIRKGASKSHHIAQAYLCDDGSKVVRARLKGNKAYLTIKIAQTDLTRFEFEYESPLNDGRALIESCYGGKIEKERLEIFVSGKLWEVDVFSGDNKGLVLAEIELDKEDEQFLLPEWVTEEVTHDYRYLNASLVKEPFFLWK